MDQLIKLFFTYKVNCLTSNWKQVKAFLEEKKNNKNDKTPILKFFWKIRNYDSTSDCLAVIYVTSCPCKFTDNTKHTPDDNERVTLYPTLTTRA